MINKNKKPLSLNEFMKLSEDCFILDTRDMSIFEKGFVPGSINIPLSSQFAIWTASLLVNDEKIILITNPGTEEEALKRLLRTGVSNI